jgi:hypothetical protein
MTFKEAFLLWLMISGFRYAGKTSDGKTIWKHFSNNSL